MDSKRASIVMPFEHVKHETVNKIKAMINEYNESYSSKTLSERLSMFEQMYLVIYTTPEIIAQHPKLRNIVSLKYNEIIKVMKKYNLSSKIISDFKKFKNIIKKRPDYKISIHNYNLRFKKST